MRKGILACAALSCAIAFAGHAQAGVYRNITIDGNFSDWAGVPVVATANNAGAVIPLESLQIANDSTNVYFLLTFSASTNPQTEDGTFMAVDSDNDPSTGYNIFGSNAIGSNFGFQNDFPFTQTQSQFNSGGTVVNATYSASPYNVATMQQEIAVPLSAYETDVSPGGYTGFIFPSTFTVEFYNDNGDGSVLGPATYTLAAVPEPGTLALLAVGGVPMLMRRRRIATA